MNSASIESVTNLYSCANELVVRWYSVRFPELHRYSIALDQLAGLLGDSAEDDFWYPVIRKSKRFRFHICAAPLSEEILQDELSELILLIKAKVSACHLMYPAASNQLLLALDHMDTLSKMKIAYLLVSLVEVMNITPENPVRTALLIKESRLVSRVEQTLSNHPRLREVIVVNPTILREQNSYEQLIAIGPSRWYPDYVFSAPRSSNILVMKYSWIKDGWQPAAVFAEPLKRRIIKQTIIFDETEEDSAASPEGLLPAMLDFQLIARKASDELQSGEELDYVDARAFLLEDEWAVFLDGDEAASAIVIDLERDYLKPIKELRPVNYSQECSFC
jgi:hypothetical protein